MDDAIRLLLVGYGRMGKLIDALAAEYNCEIVGRLSSTTASDEGALGRDRWPNVDVVVDFTTAHAFLQNAPRLFELGAPLVVGTTGWQQEGERIRSLAQRTGTPVVAAANFSVGVTIFESLVEGAGRMFAAREDYGAWIHEAHHRAKRDAPSGTALVLESALRRGGYTAPIDVASTRAGSIPGTHTVGFDALSETITLTHTTRDRATFARGALLAARWVRGRQGWFGMRDVLGIE